MKPNRTVTGSDAVDFLRQSSNQMPVDDVDRGVRWRYASANQMECFDYTDQGDKVIKEVIPVDTFIARYPALDVLWFVYDTSMPLVDEAIPLEVSNPELAAKLAKPDPLSTKSDIT